MRHKRSPRLHTEGPDTINDDSAILVLSLTPDYVIEEARAIHEAHAAKETLLRALGLCPRNPSTNLAVAHVLANLDPFFGEDAA